MATATEATTKQATGTRARKQPSETLNVKIGATLMRRLDRHVKATPGATKLGVTAAALRDHLDRMEVAAPSAPVLVAAAAPTPARGKGKGKGRARP